MVSTQCELSFACQELCEFSATRRDLAHDMRFYLYITCWNLDRMQHVYGMHAKKDFGSSFWKHPIIVFLVKIRGTLTRSLCRRYQFTKWKGT